MKRLNLIPQLCTGCGLCELACSLLRSSRPPGVGSGPLIEVDAPGSLRFCSQCVKQLCAEVCLRKAIFVDPRTGATRVDLGKCDGCGKCVGACTAGAVHRLPGDPVGRVDVCDLCSGRPLCAAICPTLALRYETPEVFLGLVRELGAGKVRSGWVSYLAETESGSEQVHGVQVV